MNTSEYSLIAQGDVPIAFVGVSPDTSPEIVFVKTPYNRVIFTFSNTTGDTLVVIKKLGSSRLLYQNLTTYSVFNLADKVIIELEFDNRTIPFVGMQKGLLVRRWNVWKFTLSLTDPVKVTNFIGNQLKDRNVSEYNATISGKITFLTTNGVIEKIIVVSGNSTVVSQPHPTNNPVVVVKSVSKYKHEYERKLKESKVIVVNTTARIDPKLKAFYSPDNSTVIVTPKGGKVVTVKFNDAKVIEEYRDESSLIVLKLLKTFKPDGKENYLYSLYVFNNYSVANVSVILPVNGVTYFYSTKFNASSTLTLSVLGHPEDFYMMNIYDGNSKAYTVVFTLPKRGNFVYLIVTNEPIELHTLNTPLAREPVKLSEEP